MSAKPFDQVIVGDFETAWGRAAHIKLGFSAQTNEEYVRDPRFKAWGMSWKYLGSDDAPVWVTRKDLPAFFKSIDWSRTGFLAQNTMFDAFILAHHYNVHPAFLMDTLSMGRALRGVEAGNSLARLAQMLGLPEKGKGLAPSENILDELPADVEEVLAEYCCHDTWLCEQIFFGLGGWSYPTKELRLIDMTLKMYTRAALLLDRSMLINALSEEGEKREGLLKRLGVEETALASNDKFSQVLAAMGVTPPTKISKTTGKAAFAFAKNDALFQAMLNGEREDVALLCEARLRVKSTTERTRAQRFLDISGRGPLPVPLSYFGAATGRWTAARGSAINMQNLKRGSFLRKAIMAPVGHQLVVGDLSQIEPRVLAWLADYQDLLDIFRAGGDPYATFGSQMFNIPGLSKESHPDLRQSAKSALLGCFGPNTPVLTNRGWVPIVRVQATDTVWDGGEWVCHQGVVPQGEKEVLTAAGISATSDHEILTEHGWVEWSAALADRTLLKSALLLGNSPVSAGAARQLVDSILLCSVPAGGQGLLTATTLLQGALRAAMPALKESLLKLDGNKKGTTWSALIDTIVTDCWTASAPSSSGAQTRTVPCTQTTEDAGLPYTKDGLRTALSSFVTSSGLAAGIDLSYSSTESTTTGGTNPATCVSSHAASTCPTSDASLRERSKRSDSGSPPLKQRMPTFDIAYAGPRNRYTVLTMYGPIIVHNCGYGLGWASFASQLLVGFLGAPPVRYDLAFAKKLGVTGEQAQKFLDWDVNVQKLEAIPHTCTTKELVIHCLAAKAIIDKYRATATPVVAFWELMNSLIEDSLYKGKEYTLKCLTFKKGQIVLPSGMPINYPGLNVKRTTDEKTGKSQTEWTYGENRIKLYGGKVTNNVTQGVARCVMTDGMLRTSKRYFVAGTVHDEQIVVVPDADVEEAKTWVLAQMTMEPPYMPGIPLDADGGAHRRYGLAKN